MEPDEPTDEYGWGRRLRGAGRRSALSGRSMRTPPRRSRSPMAEWWQRPEYATPAGGEDESVGVTYGEQGEPSSWPMASPGGEHLRLTYPETGSFIYEVGPEPTSNPFAEWTPEVLDEAVGRIDTLGTEDPAEGVRLGHFQRGEMTPFDPNAPANVGKEWRDPFEPPGEMPYVPGRRRRRGLPRRDGADGRQAGATRTGPRLQPGRHAKDGGTLGRRRGVRPHPRPRRRLRLLGAGRARRGVHGPHVRLGTRVPRLRPGCRGAWRGRHPPGFGLAARMAERRPGQRCRLRSGLQDPRGHAVPSLRRRPPAERCS